MLDADDPRVARRNRRVGRGLPRARADAEALEEVGDAERQPTVHEQHRRVAVVQLQLRQKRHGLDGIQSLMGQTCRLFASKI